MSFTTWLMGPQLIGFVFILGGLIQTRYPPKEINSLYGYRTARSMKDQQNWDEGNRYSTKLIAQCGWVLVIVGVIVTIALLLINVNAELSTIIKLGLMLAGALGTVIVLFWSTEKHLKRTFDDKPL